ncbi:hydroxymethylbilane synthase [Desulforhopalus singaporensis]|uniref:Hydroxymethylbilane synthase n=1 Tax=Desulforhopalus singaporensis TaxID=91360 RepID=A0A1H0QYE4_9BACT|nr:hydroxymethylbilane synthase [Desulforhopalus singaporensis]SDP22301.1 hydroxymethylbilane synthase [Desulforhopalus singaporensis]
MITIGTRKSKLAMWQTETVASMLEQGGLRTRINSMETIGDKILDRSIAKIGSKGVFTAELEEQLQSGLTDIAVHSAKDMQSQLPDGFTLIAYTKREKVNDILLSDDSSVDIDAKDKPLIIGTSSVRRRAFLRHYYPHVQLVEMRGNLQTRIRKMQEGACDALMLAYAGVVRMGYGDMIVHEFGVDQFVPPVGQGCIAVECAVTLAPEKVEKIRASVNDLQSEACLLAERAFLKKLEGGCSIPAFGHATLDGDELTLTAGLASLDGATIVRTTRKGSARDPEKLGIAVGEYILANNGRKMLAEIKNLQKS